MNKDFLKEEHDTFLAMLHMYCKSHHDYNGSLCEKCSELAEYSHSRLSHCPFKEHKPTCGKCTAHCYKSKMRTEVKKVMRWSGPRMLFKHPGKAFRHFLHSKRKPPELQNLKKT